MKYLNVPDIKEITTENNLDRQEKLIETILTTLSTFLAEMKPISPGVSTFFSEPAEISIGRNLMHRLIEQPDITPTELKLVIEKSLREGPPLSSESKQFFEGIGQFLEDCDLDQQNSRNALRG